MPPEDALPALLEVLYRLQGEVQRLFTDDALQTLVRIVFQYHTPVEDTLYEDGASESAEPQLTVAWLPPNLWVATVLREMHPLLGDTLAALPAQARRAWWRRYRHTLGARAGRAAHRLGVAGETVVHVLEQARMAWSQDERLNCIAGEFGRVH